MIVNLTQHPATADQIAAGVVDISDRARLCALLTFDELPTAHDIQRRADALASLVIGEHPQTAYDSGVISAMIGGAPYLMAPLEASLRAIDVIPLYAFSVRESVEQIQPDGSTKKIATFKHAGFVGAA